MDELYDAKFWWQFGFCAGMLSGFAIAGIKRWVEVDSQRRHEIRERILADAVRSWSSRKS